MVHEWEDIHAIVGHAMAVTLGIAIPDHDVRGIVVKALNEAYSQGFGDGYDQCNDGA